MFPLRTLAPIPPGRSACFRVWQFQNLLDGDQSAFETRQGGDSTLN